MKYLFIALIFLVGCADPQIRPFSCTETIKTDAGERTNYWSINSTSTTEAEDAVYTFDASITDVTCREM